MLCTWWYTRQYIGPEGLKSSCYTKTKLCPKQVGGKIKIFVFLNQAFILCGWQQCLTCIFVHNFRAVQFSLEFLKEVKMMLVCTGTIRCGIYFVLTYWKNMAFIEYNLFIFYLIISKKENYIFTCFEAI